MSTRKWTLPVLALGAGAALVLGVWSGKDTTDSIEPSGQTGTSTQGLLPLTELPQDRFGLATASWEISDEPVHEEAPESSEIDPLMKQLEGLEIGFATGSDDE